MKKPKFSTRPPTKGSGIIGALFGAFFAYIGITVAIPEFGTGFGLTWIAASVIIIVWQLHVAFSADKDDK